MTRYLTFDRAEWAARVDSAGAASEAVAAAPVTAADHAEIYRPLALFVAERAAGTVPYVVAVTGSVAAGKSAAAAALAAALTSGPPARPVAVVCTDGFLLPNRVLAARRLSDRKGFPESFDHNALAQFVRDVRSGAASARAPVYSHATYDIVAGAVQTVGRPDVLVLEGLPLPEEHVDLTVYVDADEADIERWFVARFCALCIAARTDETSFFRSFANSSEAQAADFAHRVWAAINHVNLVEHILPVRERSDVILEKDADHAIRRVRLRTD